MQGMVFVIPELLYIPFLFKLSIQSMKTFIFTGLLVLFSLTSSYGQLSVGYHQSNLPFASIGYEISDRLMPELRLSTDVNMDYNFSPELVLTYQLINKPSYEFYAGLGYRTNNFQGPVLPVGFNFFPFENKNFGFHLELAPIVEIEGATILRGSWGIRYRFVKE